MRRANVVKNRLLQAYRKKNRKLYEKENKLLLLLLYYVITVKGLKSATHSPLVLETRMPPQCQ